MLRGLFIGIDKYKPPVTRLSCAVADAQAIGGLFADSLDGEFKSLVDGAATQESIRRELEALVASEPDDFVVITFSGHGTEDHRLVPVEPDGSLTLTALGRYAGESGIEVRSITRIGSALRYAPAELGPADVVTLAQVTVELEPLYIPANRRSRQEQQRWPLMLQQLGVAYGLNNGLHVGGGDPFTATKRAVACLLLMSSRPMAEIERILLQHTRDRSAAGNIRQVASTARRRRYLHCRAGAQGPAVWAPGLSVVGSAAPRVKTRRLGHKGLATTRRQYILRLLRPTYANE